jgi:hypothetical protein
MNRRFPATLTKRALLARYRAACRFTQRVDREAIRSAIRRWADGMEIPPSIAICFAECREQPIGIALSNQLAASGIDDGARPRPNIVPQCIAEDDRRELDRSIGAAAWRGWAAWNERAVASRPVRDRYFVTDGRDFGWGICDPATFLVDAAASGDQAMVRKWLPLLEALEHGCFCLARVRDVIWVGALPTKALADGAGRLHCSEGPAFEWLGVIGEFYLDGVLVSPLVVQSPERMTVETIGMERNSESRRVMIERYRPGERINGPPAFTSDVQARRDNLMARYRAACRLTQTVDRDKIQSAIRRWADHKGFSRSVPICFAETREQAIYAAAPTWNEGISHRRRAVPGLAPNCADDEVRRELLGSAGAAAWQEWELWNVSAVGSKWACDRRNFSWGTFEAARSLLDAAADRDEALVQEWLPLFEALEHGCFCLTRVRGALWATVLPTKVVVDNAGRLHCSEGPAFEWLDEVREFYWHGVRVPPFLINAPELITVAMIELERNSEVQRVMIERYRSGEEINAMAAFVRDAGGERIDHDERFGTLWRRRIPYNEPITLLEVVNATPEKGGRSKHYFLRVPPTMSKAHEAAAWTFGLAPQVYVPSIET